MRIALPLLSVLATVIGGPSLRADNARLDVDGRGSGITLELVTPPAGGTAGNASWLTGEAARQCLSVEVPAAADWKAASFAFKPNGTGRVLVKLTGQYRASDAQVPKPVWLLYDDLELSGGALRNTTFDRGIDGWITKDASAFVADQGHSQPGSIRAWCGSPATQELAVQSGQVVTVSFWFRRLDGRSSLRLFTIGHSFHANWLPGWLKQVEEVAGEVVHDQAGVSMLGGSRVIQHWNLPDGKNTAKSMLTTGKVDVLTLAPMLSPDDGITNFARLALVHNPGIRITVQEFWLPFDRLDCFGEKSYGDQATVLRDWADPIDDPGDPQKGKLTTAHFNVPTPDQVEKLHAPYFAKMDAYIAEQNRALGRPVMAVVPVGQAVVALRRKIVEGKVPGIARQSDLFIDKLGHPGKAICALSAYCHFAVIYQRSPVGLPLLPWLAKGNDQQDRDLNLLLQQLAWDAVTHHPLSGVTHDQQSR